MIMPSTPNKMLAASLAAASMDPLGVWIAHLRGFPVPSLLNTLVLCMPNYSCAVVAVVPARFLQRMGRRLREAEDLGSYRLIERLGHGGMGEVWRAQHRLLARHAAIKLIRPELLGAGSPDEAKHMMRRFEREARATAALSSPHTIQLFDYGMTDDGTFYYVMELLTGRDLETLVREFGPLPAERAMFLLRQVCHSLADAHARGLVHRDIKPANIYVCRMGLDYDFAKVLDFGLVKFKGARPLAGDSLADGGAAHERDTRLHGARGHPRRHGRRSPRRCVCARVCRVLSADRTAGLRGRNADENADAPRAVAARAAVATDRAADPARARRARHVVPGEGSQQAAAECRGAVPAGVRRARRAKPGARRLASLWWQTHLPDLTGPLSVEDFASDPNRETAAIL